MFFYIKVSSKSKDNLKTFLSFFTNSEVNSNLFIKYFPKQKVKKFVSVLKSPHVNKTAQEQFEYRVYTKKLSITSTQHFQFLYILKKIQRDIFPFINIKIKSFYSRNKMLDHILTNMDSNNIPVTFLNNKNFYNKNKCLNLLKTYFQFFDSYGELYFKHNKFLYL